MKLMILIFGILLAASHSVYGATGARPNIIVIMTDDEEIGAQATMPSVRALARNGVSFTDSFTVYPVCAASRVSFLTGQYPHNHGVVSNVEADDAFAPRAQHAIGKWLQARGYKTALIGKYLNGYVDSRVPPGWSRWWGMQGHQKYDYTLVENGVPHYYGSSPSDYSTDVLAKKAVQFISAQTGPFYLHITPPVPHEPATTPPSHVGDLAGLSFNPSPDFNELDVQDKPEWVRNLPLLDEAEISWVSNHFRRRRTSLLSVDDLVKKVVDALEAKGIRDNTYIIYTSDNGYCLGQHRWVTKWVPYECSIRVPLIMVGPGIPANETRRQLVSTIDVTATILQWAGATATVPLDGRPLQPVLANPARPWRTALYVRSNWGGGGAWHAVRTAKYMHARYQSNGDQEFYRLKLDPFQLDNRAKYETRVLSKLRQILNTLRTCVGKSCWITEEP